MIKYKNGFTIIELMIVVTIIGILAAVAVPFYQNYIARAQISEAFIMIDSLKTPIVSYVGQNGICPDNASGSVDVIAQADSYKGKYVARIATSGTVPNCTAEVTFVSSNISAAIQSTKIFVELHGQNSVSKCIFPQTTAPVKLLPTGCL